MHNGSLRIGALRLYLQIPMIYSGAREERVHSRGATRRRRDKTRELLQAVLCSARGWPCHHATRTSGRATSNRSSCAASSPAGCSWHPLDIRLLLTFPYITLCALYLHSLSEPARSLSISLSLSLAALMLVRSFIRPIARIWSYGTKSCNSVL